MQKKDEATMKKNGPTTKREEPTKKKTEAKEEGAAASKHNRVVYSDKSRCLSKNGKTIIYFGVPAALILLIICVFAFNYIAIQPRVPRFMLEDLYVDPLSNTSVIVSVFNFLFFVLQKYKAILNPNIITISICFI